MKVITVIWLHLIIVQGSLLRGFESSDRSLSKNRKSNKCDNIKNSKKRQNCLNKEKNKNEKMKKYVNETAYDDGDNYVESTSGGSNENGEETNEESSSESNSDGSSGSDTYDTSDSSETEVYDSSETTDGTDDDEESGAEYYSKASYYSLSKNADAEGGVEYYTSNADDIYSLEDEEQLDDYFRNSSNGKGKFTLASLVGTIAGLMALLSVILAIFPAKKRQPGGSQRSIADSKYHLEESGNLEERKVGVV